ncbi:PVC-type heme-binding CxxCH protein [Aureliella helgolandensis]|uniref:FG-GAP repeat protein n=1 Tax=Aureliella helgolandensis TaxID=2527968 RepID=A0A518G0G8_9BACT|nr:PVC-type heme-binding CxxCH protein [Aureliella helgolandensis]QDV22095.1 FG-GAP repeat protein [Aureliella helgolandensis]
MENSLRHPFLGLILLTCALSARYSPVVAEDFVGRDFSRQELTDIYYSEGVAVGDINGDESLDIVYGPYWFAGPAFTDKHEIYSPQPQPTDKYADNFFSWIYDFNQDGAADVFVVGFPGTPAYVYENPGHEANSAANSQPWKKHQVIDWVSNESPQFANLVGDERPELICTRDGFFGFATIDWEHPLDAWSFHPISEQIAASRFGHGLGIGDVNGDGRIDLLHSKGWYEQPASDPTSGRWQTHEVNFSSSYGGAEMYAYDVDGDGDSDVITSEAAHDFGLSWYEQIGEGVQIEFKRHTIVGQHPSENKYGVVFSELHSVALADMDGDGLQDIVTGKTYWSHHKQSPMWDAGAVVYWFKLVQGEDGVDWIPYLVDADAGIGRQLTIADINSDGVLDVATGGMLGANVMLQKPVVLTREEWAKRQPKVYDGPKLATVEGARAKRGPRSPIAADGKVFQAIEGEEVKATVTGGTTRAQPMGSFSGDRWSGNSQLWWTGAKPGDKLTLELDAFQEVAAVELALTCAKDYGIVEIQLNGQPLDAPLDCYDAQVVTTGLLSLDTPELKKGKHTLSFEIVGANPKAVKGYMLGIDFIRFRAPGEIFPDADGGVPARNREGRVLNLDFESGDLSDWTATGDAFADQPIQGDTVSKRRNDMSSRHHGEFWIGGFEKHGDEPTGTLTSAPFSVPARYATFLLGGGSSEATRVELWGVGEEKPFYIARGKNSENLERVVVDLRRVQNGEMFLRIVDESRGGWGHVNFDHFRFHARRPAAVTPPAVQLTNDEYPYGDLSAEEAASVMKVPEGFSVTVCAAEPDVKQPIAMALDDRGRVWIAEAYEYPQRADGDTGRDRILVFEDTTGDGRLDSRKVFAEGLNLVSGLEVGFGGVWVGAAPYLLFIPDANGDDVADSEPQVLLDGWGYEDTHETLNTFCWGPDGWLYGCHGVFTHSKVGKPGTAAEDRTPINAGIWRYHPQRHEFEVFAHGTSNPWGVDFNEHGEAFITACVIPHLYHMIPGARYQRQAGQHFNPHTYDDIKTIADHLHYLGATPHSGNGKSDEAGGGHAHAGAMIYQGGAWPSEYTGALFMNNIHGQRLNVDLLAPEGSGYVGHHAPDFLLTGDQASQILNMRYGPDGQVYFIDWYDMQACHRKEVEVHDRSNGRIYKINYGTQPAVQVDLTKLSDLELAEHCLNPNDWFVRHSRRLLQERAAVRKISREAIERLVDIALHHEADERRLRALWARHAIGTSDDAMFAQLLQDTSPHVRGWALRLMLEERRDQLPAAMFSQLAELARADESPVVRRAITSALYRLPVEQRWEIVEGLVAHAVDAKDHNLPLMYWYAMEPLADVDPDRALALGMAAGEQIPKLREFMLRRVAGSGGTQAVDRMVAALSKADEPSIQQTFLTAIRASLAGQRQSSMPAAWPAAYTRLSQGGDPRVARQAAAIGVLFGDANASRELSHIVQSQEAAVESRLQALEALLAAGEASLRDTMLTLVDSPAVPAPLLEAAIRGLSQYDAPNIAASLLKAYPRMTEVQRRAAIATLCSRASSAQALLREIGEKRIPATDLSADLARQLEYLNDATVAELLPQVWGQVRKSSVEKLEQIQIYKELVADSGLPPADLPLGRAMFAKTCQRCHMLYGVGEKLGPDLTGSNRSNLDYLLENIVDPSAVMAKEYRQSIFLTDSGQVITGIVRSETENAVTVQTADAMVVLPKVEIEERRESDQSMMPENQLLPFSDHEIRSLLEYLRSKQQTPIRATSENVSTFFNGTDLSGWNGNPELWSVVDGELVGKSSGLKTNEFLVSDLAADDFRLTLEIQLVENLGNSGIQFRSRSHESGSVEGYQADVGQGWWGKLYEEHGRGLLWDQSGEAHLKPGQWNRYEVEAVGSHIRTRLNGNLCVDLDDPKGARAGVFAIQLHSGGPTEVRIRNVVLELVDAEGE